MRPRHDHIQPSLVVPARPPSPAVARAGLALLALMLCLVFAVSAPARTIGPDAAGYVATDALAYAFEDIAASGTRAWVSSQDNATSELPIGFDFAFYDGTYGAVYASSNGLLNFSDGSSHCCTGRELPSPSVADRIIAGWWENLDPGSGGDIYYQTLGTEPQRRFIVQFDGVRHFGATTPGVTFQLKLFEHDGSAEVHFQTIASDGGSHSVGLQDRAGATGLNWYFGTGVVADETAVRFYRGLTVDPLRTGDTTPILTGRIGDGAATIAITVDGRVYAGINHGDGTWSAEVTDPLVPDTYDVAATAIGTETQTDLTSGELTIAAPTLSVAPLTTPLSAPALSGSVSTVDAIVVVDLDGTVYTAINRGDGTWTLQLTRPVPPGTYDIVATATNPLGSAGDGTTDELIIEPPGIGVDPLSTVLSIPELTGTVNAADAAVAVTVNGTQHTAINNQDGTWRLPLSSPLAVGSYDVVAVATSPSGAVAADGTTGELTIRRVTVGVDPLSTSNATPELTGSVDATDARVSVSVAGQVLSASNLQDGTWRVTVPSPIVVGSHDVIAVATSPNGGADADDTVGELTISLRVDLIASYRGTADPVQVVFTDRSEPASDIVAWRWDFGDGTSSTDQHPTHVYSAGAMPYSVSLSVTTSQGIVGTITRTDLIRGWKPDVYITTEDNDDNAGTGSGDGDMSRSGRPCIYRDFGNHPIEFTIDVGSHRPAANAYLSLFMEDVDWPDERDQVYLNGHRLGLVVGEDGLNASTLFVIPDIDWIEPGRNRVEIDVDLLDGAWCARLQSGQLILDEGNGSSGDARIRRLTGNADGYHYGATASITLEADTARTSQAVRLELSLRDAAGEIVAFDRSPAARSRTLSGTEDDPYVWTFALPVSGEDGLWAVNAAVYDQASQRFQAMRSITFPVPAGAVAAPVIATITPSTGPAGAVRAVTITGRGFVPRETGCTIGGLALIGLNVIDNVSLTATIPDSLALGRYSLACTTPNGTASLDDAYTVAGPAIQVAPTALAFGNRLLTSQPRETLTITNRGDQPLHLGRLAVSGAGAFALASDGCSGAELSGVDNCTVQIGYAPTSLGGHQGRLAIPSNDPLTSELAIDLIGRGLSVDAGPDAGASEGQAVPFAATLTDGTVGGLGLANPGSLSWRFGDGDVVTGDLTATHGYADNGIYTATVTVTDDDGITASDARLLTIVNVAPTALAGSDQNVNAGTAVRFHGSHTDPGIADTHSYTWRFGDGTTAIGASPTHVYTGNGTFTVTLTVTDDDGDSGTSLVTIEVDRGLCRLCLPSPGGWRSLLPLR